jgi:hypothetical protein
MNLEYLSVMHRGKYYYFIDCDNYVFKKNKTHLQIKGLAEVGNAIGIICGMLAITSAILKILEDEKNEKPAD